MSTDPNEVRRRAGIFLLVSLAIAAGTAWVGYTLVSRYEARLEASHIRESQVEVVVAVDHLPAGVPIDAEGVALRARAASSVDTEVTFSTLDAVV